MKIATWNAAGITKRKNELELFVEDNDISILLATETFLKPNHSFLLSGFKVVRRDRPAKVGGGVAVFYRNNITAEKVEFQTSVEAIGIRALVNNEIRVFVAAYNPPNMPITHKDLDELLNHPKTLIGGDLNAKSPAWGSRIVNPNGKSLMQYQSRRSKIGVLGPEDATYFPSNPKKRGDVLDIFITNGDGQDCVPITVHCLSSDHFPVVVCLPNGRNPVEAIRRTDWIKYAWLMSKQEWTTGPIASQNIENEASAFTQTISLALNRSSFLQIPNTKNKLGLTYEEKALVRQKNKTKQEYSTRHDPRLKTKLSVLQEKVKVMLKRKKDSMWESKISQANEEMGNFWQLLRSCKRRQNPNTPLRVGNRKLFNNLEKAEVSADILVEQFNNRAPSRPDIEREATRVSDLIDEMVGEAPDIIPQEAVSAKIRSLSWKKAPGMDGISNRALKLLPNEAISSLTRLINAVIQCGVFPKVWKCAIVVTLPKKGKDPSIPENRRPISLLPGLAKLCEFFILEGMTEHLEKNGIMPLNQFGFRRKLAAIQKAAHLEMLVRLNTGPRKKTIAVLLDVAKAYDKVWRNGLLLKMYRLQLPRWMLTITRSWLADRRFQVRWDKELSSVRTAPEGLPQGSALSPLLFNVYVQDMPKFERDKDMHVLQFADDTALLGVGLSVEGAQNRIERGLKELLQYFQNWKLAVNTEKTEAILFGKKRPQKYGIIFNHQKIQFHNTVTYLGVKFDRTLRFDRHAKARKALAKDRLRAVSHLTRQGGQLSLRNRQRLATAVVLPMATYGQEIAVAGVNATHKIMNTTQNICVRRALGLPWYISNKDIQSEAKMEDPIQSARNRRERMVKRLCDHPSPDIARLGHEMKTLL